MRSAGKELSLFEGAGEDAPLVVLNTVHGEGDAVHGLVKGKTDADFSMVCVDGLDWDNELSPWSAPPISRGGAPFGGGADVYLDSLVGEIIPDAVAEMGASPSWMMIAGYSLAGLFAAYSIYRTDAFRRVASASGSFWFPGFADMAEERDPVRVPDRVYLSLGDRESRTRDPVLSTVEDGTMRVLAALRSRGTDAVFESNPGNHFAEPAERMAKGIAWTLADAGVRNQ